MYACSSIGTLAWGLRHVTTSIIDNYVHINIMILMCVVIAICMYTRIYMGLFPYTISIPNALACTTYIRMELSNNYNTIDYYFTPSLDRGCGKQNR